MPSHVDIAMLQTKGPIFFLDLYRIKNRVNLLTNQGSNVQ